MQTIEQITVETTIQTQKQATEDSAAIVELSLQDLGLVGGGNAMTSLL